MARYISFKIHGMTLEIEYDERDKRFTEACIVMGKNSVNITKFTDDMFFITGVAERTYTSLTDIIESELWERGFAIGD